MCPISAPSATWEQHVEASRERTSPDFEARQPLLAHVFQHEGTWYFADAITNDVFECDEVVAAVLHGWDVLEDEQARADLDREWGSDRVAVALEEIAELQASEGALVPKALKILHKCKSCHDESAYLTRIEHLQMTVSEQCNLRCEYCPHTAGAEHCRPHRDVFMSEETALAAVDFFLARSGDVEEPVISFYGGEPLLGFDVVKAVAKTVRSAPDGDRVRFIIDTNGTLVDEDVAAFLNDNHVYVQFSLDGPQQIHDRYRKLRNGAGSYEGVIAGIERMLAHDPRSHERMTFNATLAPPLDLRAVIDFFENFAPFHKHGVKTLPAARIQFADLTELAFQPRDLDENGAAGESEDMDDLRARYLDICKRGRHAELSPVFSSLFDKGIIDYHHRPLTILADEIFPTGSCQVGQRKIHVKADGRFLPCERGGDHMHIGDVRTGIDLQAIDRLYHKLIEAVGERCRSCWAIRSCSICFIHMATSWGPDGSGKVTISEELCDSVRSNREAVLRDYLSLERAGPQALDWLKHTTIK